MTLEELHSTVDLIGTVRREDHENGYSIWVRIDANRRQDEPGWLCVHSTAPGNVGERLAIAEGFPVVGAIPGTPAAETKGQDTVDAMERKSDDSFVHRALGNDHPADPKPLPPKYRLARNIKEGMEIWDDDTDTWIGVVHALHILSPLPVSTFDMADGSEWSMDPRDRFMCRRTAAPSGEVTR